ncbi:hypothetical protein B0H15DRAFT_49704 [Mycena belliarum]|uniref:Uncharacterized protein n=1 Tax=Mycena belliarum TaxID=1033014 RepID=A0AAD6XSJ1_9AGAR|nr:hypothetical protein B0H15DRAFT_49704 [Mycena belliae]
MHWQAPCWSPCHPADYCLLPLGQSCFVSSFPGATDRAPRCRLRASTMRWGPSTGNAYIWADPDLWLEPGGALKLPSATVSGPQAVSWLRHMRTQLIASEPPLAVLILIVPCPVTLHRIRSSLPARLAPEPCFGLPGLAFDPSKSWLGIAVEQQVLLAVASAAQLQLRLHRHETTSLSGEMPIPTLIRPGRFIKRCGFRSKDPLSSSVWHHRRCTSSRSCAAVSRPQPCSSGSTSSPWARRCARCGCANGAARPCYTLSFATARSSRKPPCSSSRRGISHRTCDIAVRVQIFPMILRTLGFGLFTSLRVLALSERNWPLAIFVFLLCFPSAIGPAYVYSHQDAAAVTRYGCGLAYTASPTLHDRLRMAGIAADILAESIAIVVTIHRTFGLRKSEVSVEGKTRPGLASYILKNGVIYFLALLVLSLADMQVLIFDHVPEFATRYDYWVVPYYTPVFRTIIICRFLLTLRAVYFDQGADGEGVTDVDNSIRFASRVIGSMGAPIDADSDGEDYFEDEPEGASGVVDSADPRAAGLEMMATRAAGTDTGVDLHEFARPPDCKADRVQV